MLTDELSDGMAMAPATSARPAAPETSNRRTVLLRSTM
jgi:hypothetical protein